ncbi:DUF724 domain-containing protein 6-like isoform X2 [Andrographis paniculata]|uniref:DUF724 domain-containing protein 6-like isoform X2 n=1 Tax=Andrographis paniculata TaxID=175694 RepID=UPI0021E8C37C|nr:DUF724 domain-containing protein 6-like isoform X2 [Andrographis paniculata]
MGGAATHPQQTLLPRPSSPPSSSPVPTPSSSPAPTSSPRRPSSHFPQGTAVEVQTNEDDFRGVFFSATVVQPPAPYTSKYGGKRKPKTLYVEYHDLLAHEDGSERLREYVALSCVRPPPPPPPPASPATFQPGDVVDAFYKDGWWTGVVKRATQGAGADKYVVTFQHPPDELHFRPSDLRVHLDWVNGGWVRPPRQSVAGLMFDVGRKVEVSLDREIYQDAWFPATIHKHLKNGAFWVEYCSANSDNEVQALKVTINYPCIRPCPPFLKDRNFVLLEKVDAFFDFAWWTGVITKELENGYYIVFFKQLKRDKEFHQSKLRPHMEWKDGKWFTSSQDVTIQSPDISMHDHFMSENFSASSVAVPLNHEGDKRDICDPLLLSSETTGQVHCSEVSPVDQKEVVIAGAENKVTHNSSSKDTICGSPSPVSVANMSIPAMKIVNRDHLSDTSSGVKRIRRKQRNSDATVSVSKKVNSTLTSLNLSSPNHDVEEMVGSESGAKGKRGHTSNSKEMMNLGSDKKQRLNDSMVSKMKDNKPLGIGVSSERKKRGRPKKILLESVQSAAKGNAQNEAVGSDDANKRSDDPHRIPEGEVMEMDASLPVQEIVSNKNKLPDGHSDHKNGNGGKKKRLLSNMRDEKVLKESTRLQAFRRGRRQVRGGKVAPQALDLPNESGEKAAETNQAMELEHLGCEAPGNELDDEPLSKWIEGMHSSFLIDGSRPPPVSTVDKFMENGKKKGNDDVVVENIEKQPKSDTGASDLADTEDSIGQSEAQNLPFIKTAFIWKTIESMDVFQRIPQKPHFKPLENCNESSREGMAVGYMVTFSSVVEKTCRLQLDDPKCVIDDILGTLAELERHGFEVKIVRDRANELLAVKDKQEKLINEVKALKEHMLERDHEKLKIDEEIKGINEEMRRLQEKLSCAELAKQKTDGEIASLHMKLEGAKEIMENMGSKFVAIASSAIGQV